MILDVMQAAAAEPVPWWMSATAPWWATPVATLAGAVLAWGLARLTSGRTAQREDTIALREKKLAAYSDFWAAGLAYTRNMLAGNHETAHDILVRASEVMLTIELFGSKDVVDAAREVLFTMDKKVDSDTHTAAMSAFRLRVGEDLKHQSA